MLYWMGLNSPTGSMQPQLLWPLAVIVKSVPACLNCHSFKCCCAAAVVTISWPGYSGAL